ncbi:dachsous cadherin-related 1 [Oratosquilla oratoria]|uniref:dachsous cadherin-related 1 n=1 Tax=Oratosquilla oratoria TaxID=337810 RepID=UPI003F7615F3
MGCEECPIVKGEGVWVWVLRAPCHPTQMTGPPSPSPSPSGGRCAAPASATSSSFGGRGGIGSTPECLGVPRGSCRQCLDHPSPSRVVRMKGRTVEQAPHRTMALMVLLLTLSSAVVSPVKGEYERVFEVSESVPINTNIGFIGESNPGQQPPKQPPYIIIPVPGNAVDSDLRIEQDTGEIKTRVLLDREFRSSYTFVAIPQKGEHIRVLIKVKDENDNAPTFPSPVLNIEFPESTPRDIKRTLAAAKDRDLGIFNTQRYDIVSGNVNNAFRLSSHRERDGVLYLDLQINGFLDRETTAFYSLLIEAWDGGSPPLKGSMTVNITIQDVNDNQPIFNQSRYFATVPENATIGTSVLQVFATDTDAGDNGKITYSINRRQSDRENMFLIDSKTGVISLNRPLDFEAKDVHELVVVARDNGDQPLETTAFVSIRVIDVNDNQPTINLIFLSDDATPKISEDAQPGKFVARISVNDPDSKEEYANVNVTLKGGEGHFGLTTQDNIIYLMIVSRPLDRELKPNYTLVVIATDQGNPPLHASREFDLQVTDMNDNAPEFDQTVYQANVLEVADPGTSVFQLSALDRDEGNNSVITYSIRETPETHSDWFQIDSRTGLITTRTHVDCETDPEPQITVIATDSGSPPLSSSATVKVTIRDVNDNEPIFDQSFYNVSVQEAQAIGNCILKVSATDPDCGVNAIVNYTIGDGSKKINEFEIQPVTGDICISGQLDHETRPVYEFAVVATDRGGLSTTAQVKIQLLDVNDNLPTFYPQQYNVSLREEQHKSSSPVVVVVATDKDAGIYGQVTYEIVSGNEASIFSIDSKTGEIFVTRPLSRATPMYHIRVSARDGAGLRSNANAEVAISVIDTNQEPPIFEKPRYTFSVEESVPKGFTVGTVTATSSGGGEVRYSIYSGDPNGYFTIDPLSGTLRTASPLDHESHPFVLLNVLATSGSPPTYGHTQVNISIWDVNDNAPEFDVVSVKISVPENAPLNDTLYAAHGTDHDSGDNGVIRYDLVQNPGNMFLIDKEHGILMLAEALDYEAVQKYTLVIGAMDKGRPPLSTNLTVNLEVQDVNDNPPVFEKEEYLVEVIESLPANSQFLQVTAKDLDTGNNARLTYTIKEKEFEKVFGVFPNSGSLYLKEVLDREARDRYVLTLVATDNGTPVSTTSTTVTITVLDANDNSPAFTRQVYEFTVEENLESGALVGRVSAEDKDLGNNASLKFAINPNNGSFQIDPVTGEILTRAALDRELKAVYEVTAEVTDEGEPPRRARATVRVLVTDVNDNSPTFIEPREPSVSVREEQPAGTEVLQVRATDRDEGNNASITYSFISNEDSDDDGAFTINPTTGVITTTKVLDHEAKQLYSVVVLASDQGNPPRTVTKVIQIEVLDLNDNRPKFSSSSLAFKVKEGIPVGEEVGSVIAIDSDGGENGRVTYTILSGNTYGTFDINKTTGHVFTAKEVDYELASEYMLQVKAVDSSATNPQSSIINVKIEVQDENDQAPVFKEDPIIFSISENTPIGTPIWNFTAVDMDSGDNGYVKYSMTKQVPKTLFKLDAVTGMLTLMAPLDYEERQEFTLIVTATDQARDKTSRLATSVTARIIVEDFNDNVPKFVSRSRVDILEDEPEGYAVLHVIATDEDSRDNGRVTYIINSGNEDGHFALEYETGVLTIVKPLDREVATEYRLNVTASDHGKPQHSATQLIEIFIEDVNDNPPQFSIPVYHANVSEGSVPGTFVTRVTATDSDHGTNSNLTYIIPAGIGDNKFRINPATGDIHTVATLDREEKERYTLTVYVRDGSFPAQYDTASVLVSLTDVNDHAPEFRDSCYPLRVPENTDLSIIHTVLATDRDAGLNGHITYSISGGNVGNKFTIDTYSGQLSSRPLDRESRAKYFLEITAEDRGTPAFRGLCNITITVEDQNDNDPKFTQNRYTASIPEDAPPDTTVMTVRATDEDQGDNARITYSLNNETQWLFKINNETGVITTAGEFDREKQTTYTFEVRATDGGRYNARSEKAYVQITIRDVNDNKPVFLEYPYTQDVPAFIQPGRQLLKVTAVDKDEGVNANVVYSLVSESADNKFRINAETGIVTATSSHGMESGRLFHVMVVAKDKGSPSQSSTGLVEIRVGEAATSTSLKFQMTPYSVELAENAPAGSEVVKVDAFRSDGRLHRITYSFGSGNEDDIFEISSNNGLIRVRNPARLDYETYPQIRLVIVAQAESQPPLYAYTTVFVNLIDMNDNAPRFTQDSYISSVWEGNLKGTYVMQVSATDDDTGSNANIVYHIVDGNHDNAFVIDPPFSGIVKTNIVLDREIRDAYKLTIIATDDGAPQLTGTCTLRINIVDVNDNQPTFPPHSIVQVSEGSEVGTVITTITANDVDTNPAITYKFAVDGNPLDIFSIDKFSGKITLAAPLDHETRAEYMLQVEASDAAHITRTAITVQVVDENDNAPVFTQQAYQVTLPELSPRGTSVIQVNATDVDKGNNARVRYSLSATPDEGFYINERSGVIYTNTSVNYSPRQPVIQLVVTARDSGSPSLAAVAAVRIQVTDVNNNAPKFSKEIYTAHVSEDATRGHVVIRVPATDIDESRGNRNIDFSIVGGNEAGAFQITSNTGEIILVKPLDREKEQKYHLIVLATDRGKPSRNATADINITVDDVNDHPPVFNQTEYDLTLSESFAVGERILQLFATDNDSGDNAKITYDITSGNDMGLFSLDSETGIVTLTENFDYDLVTEHRFIVRATDGSRHRPLSALATVRISLEDENDNVPQFPVDAYLEFIPENSPVGTSVFTAHANDADKGKFGKLSYSISSGEDKDMFNVDPKTGVVTAEVVFDYESRKVYFFTLRAVDEGGKSATVSVQVNVESVDEFAPVFSQRNYIFTIPSGAEPGVVVGRVEAVDKDDGPDGRVFFSLKQSSSSPGSELFKINRTSGEIIVRRKPKRDEGILIDVVANSGLDTSLRSNAVAEISLGGRNGTWNSTLSVAGSQDSGGLATWAIGLLIALILLVLVFGGAFLFLYRRNIRSRKPVMADQFDTSFDTIDIRPQPTAPTDLSQYPTRYNDLPHFEHHGERSHHHGNTTSEMSEQSHSASSGRGSAEDNEDVEDEEIRMINEGPLMQQQKIRERITMPADSGIREDDNMSDVSVHNTQEYLARLGIDTTKSESTKGSQDLTHSMESMFDDEGGGEADGMDISNLIYAKLNEVSPEEEASIMDGTRAFSFGDESQPSMTGSLSSIVHSEEELQGSYNWDYLLDWGPQYQPLAHVFSEIARLKDDSAPNFSREPMKKTLNPQVKTIPPPLLTSVAPRSIAPVALTSARTSQMTLPSLPRSPISHESSFTSPAMSPSFSPSLSPLATRSPSISPLMTPGTHGPAGPVASQTSAASTPHHGRPVGQRPGPAGLMAGTSSGSETELRI